MKTHRLVIGIMVGVILLQTAFLANYKLRLTRYEAMGDVQVIQERPHIYIMELTDAVDRLGRETDTLVYQNVWLSRHLEKCLDELEKYRGLEPIPFEGIASGYARPPWSGAGGPRFPTMPAPPEGPFLKSYVEPNFPSIATDEDEKTVHFLHCFVNLKTSGVAAQTFSLEQYVRHFEKRLERVQPQNQ